jgi:hypothetical protein
MSDIFNKLKTLANCGYSISQYFPNCSQHLNHEQLVELLILVDNNFEIYQEAINNDYYREECFKSCKITENESNTYIAELEPYIRKRKYTTVTSEDLIEREMSHIINIRREMSHIIHSQHLPNDNLPSSQLYKFSI